MRRCMRVQTHLPARNGTATGDFREGSGSIAIDDGMIKLSRRRNAGGGTHPRDACVPLPSLLVPAIDFIHPRIGAVRGVRRS